MSTNKELAKVFSEMAALLEITGANRFRVISHERVARTLEELPEDVATLAADPARLTAIDGVGQGSAKKIVEYVETGAVSEHQTLLNEVPAGLLDVLKIPGLGPKTVRLLWEEGGVIDMTSLEKALDAGTLADLPRMGEKTIENIRASIRFAAKAAERARLGSALPIAEAIVAELRTVDGVKQIQYGGSLRRGQETIGDIDILAATDDPRRLSETFRAMDEVEQVLVAGSTKSSVRFDRGIQVDLRVVEASAFGAALLYFTGSKTHNVTLRERAIKRGYRLNEYGLFPDDGDDEPPQTRGVVPVASKTEEAIYAALELPWIPPELRENRGEFGAGLPDLITDADITSELHAHTIASDGRMTIEELASEARRRGLHTIAVTDHSRSSVQANGLSEDDLHAQLAAVRTANEAIDGITILAGSEVDILTDGRLDYDDELLAELDIVVASPHAALTQDASTATKRLLAAIEHPLVHIIGHPTGRVIGRRKGLAPDIPTLVAAAKEHHTALEINANALRLDLRDTHVRAAVDAGVWIAINTDAHAARDFDQLRYGVMTARRGWLSAAQCVNCMTPTDLRAWLAAKRAGAHR